MIDQKKGEREGAGAAETSYIAIYRSRFGSGPAAQTDGWAEAGGGIAGCAR